MVLRFNDQLRYAAAAALLAVAWGYRKLQRGRSSEDSAPDPEAIPPFRKLAAKEARQLRAPAVKRIPGWNGSDFLNCEVAVLGSASGGGMPSLASLLSSEQGCTARAGSDERNTRTPQALMVRVCGPESAESFVALVDCSQATKRQICMARSMLGQFQLGAVLMTGGQVDKYIGLNDLREVQHASKKDFRSGSGELLGIYASCSTIETVKTALPFLFNVKQQTKTLVAGLDAWGLSDKLGERLPMSPDVPVTVRAIPCKDGQLGFVFGRDSGCVVIVPEPEISSEAREWLSARDVQLLVIGTVADRAALSACAQLVKAVKPWHAVATGLSDGLDHVTAEDLLRAEVGALSVSVAYDGMMLETRIEDEDLSKPCLGECSCLSSGSTAPGSASSGSETITDEDRCISLSPTHGPVEAGVRTPGDGAGDAEGPESSAEGPPALTPVALSALAQ